jgi:NADPH-dependent glutamate synthase beta subunit-like oxidoreductase
MASSVAFDDLSVLRACEQCGTCSSACPLTGVDEFNIRRILRHVELGFIDEIAATPLAWHCTVCARCESVCPNKVPVIDIVRRLRTLAPAEYVPEAPAPCIAACPAGIDIPGYLRLIAQGEPTGAYELILKSAPFPGILGRVCPAPCEVVCRRAEVNEAVAICALKRYAADHVGGFSAGALAVAEPTGRKIAVIGAGPAGLTAAFYLRKKGHDVTVFEARDKAGGMMRYGIPRYRLPEDVLEREVEQVLSVGIELKTNQRFGEDFGLDALREQGFEAFFLAAGLQRSKQIDLEGAELDDAWWGLDFLCRVGAGETVDVKPRVVVIGGGDVAIDAALTALRLGAENVTMVCLESEEQMPAHAAEVSQAEEEGVELMTSWGPRRILAEEGRVSAIELVRCESVFDEQGTFNPTFGDERTTIPADQVILSIGQTADLSFAGDRTPVAIDRSLVVVTDEAGRTDIDDLFVGGEIATGPGDLIAAIGEGRKVAAGIDAFLGGDGVIDGPPPDPVAAQDYDGSREKGFADRVRIDPAVLPLEERRKGFAEVTGCLDRTNAVEEAGRCLDCDLEGDPLKLIQPH